MELNIIFGCLFLDFQAYENLAEGNTAGKDQTKEHLELQVHLMDEEEDNLQKETFFFLRLFESNLKHTYKE